MAGLLVKKIERTIFSNMTFLITNVTLQIFFLFHRTLLGKMSFLIANMANHFGCTIFIRVSGGLASETNFALLFRTIFDQMSFLFAEKTDVFFTVLRTVSRLITDKTNQDRFFGAVFGQMACLWAVETIECAGFYLFLCTIFGEVADLITFIAFFFDIVEFGFETVEGCVSEFLTIITANWIFGTFFGIVSRLFTEITHFFIWTLRFLVAQLSTLKTFVSLFGTVFGKMANFLASMTYCVVELGIGFFFRTVFCKMAVRFANMTNFGLRTIGRKVPGLFTVVTYILWLR